MNLVIVTGTTKGLGAALYAALVNDQNNVVIAVSRGIGNSVDGDISERMGSLNAIIGADFGDVVSVELAFNRIALHLSDIGKHHFERAVLINNAGVVLPVGAFDQIDGEGLKNNIHVNLISPMVAMRRFAELTRSIARQRLIINISSGAAKRAIAGWSAYCAAKAGLEMAAQVAALEAAANDPTLAICALAPGVIDTPMQSQVRLASADAFPDVERFRAMKMDGMLRPADEVAHDIIRLMASGKLTNGGSFDIRTLV